MSPPPFTPKKPRGQRGARAFTLVELLVVVAIIGILMIVALPAYNNYSTKSKFTEVVLATAPTKTAIATCAGTGDCVSGGAISVATTTTGATPTLLVPNAANTASNAPNAMAVWTAAWEADGLNPSTAAQFAGSYMSSGYAVIQASPTQLCFSTNGISCAFPDRPSIASFNQFYAPNAAILNGTAVTPTSTSAMNLPCVGPAATGCSPPTKYAASVSFDGSGDITATAQVTSGLNGETFVLMPQYSGGRVDWSVSGSCKTRAGGALC